MNKKIFDVCKGIIGFLGLFLSYFIIQFKNINAMWFGTDELDIMIIGRGISRGQLLYVDALSQHMPISYYISAFFCKLGADTVTEQRIAFYILIAMMWTGIVFIYSSFFDKKTLMIFPLFHCCMIQNYDLGTQILSEHLAGCGAIILLLEFLNFSRTRKIEWKSCIMISISVLLTFGTIFVAIYPIFFICVGVLFLELKWRKNDGIKVLNWLVYIVKKYYKLVSAIMFPWIILIGYFLYTHTFSEFIYGAYTINRELYPKYNGGLGSSIFAQFFSGIEIVGKFFYNGFNINEWNYVLLLEWIFVLAGIVFIYRVCRQEGKITGVFIALFTFSFGMRGIYNFHGTACVELLAFMLAYLFVELVYKEFTHMNNIKQYVCICVIIFILSGYFNNISTITNLNLIENDTVHSSVIKEITDEDESIWMVMMDNNVAMLSDRTVIGASPTTPWTWEGFGKKQFKQFKKNAPRVALFDENFEVWGYKLKNYAPEVIKYIKNNYKLIPGTTNVYVVKDYYDEACKKLEIQ